MDFRAFGAVQTYRGKQEVELGGPKQRAVLALLLARPGRVVSADSLIDEIWGDAPPEAAAGTLQAYISRLRRALGSDTIAWRAPGYVLVDDGHEIDLGRFEALAGSGHDALGDGDFRGTRRDLQAALDLWRGPPFAGVADTPALSLEAARLRELRSRVREDLFAAELELGERHDLVAELEAAVAAEPFREALRGHLMVALYQEGRQAEALRTFRELEDLLRDELGLDASPELRRLEERILRQDPTLEPGERALRGYRLVERLGEGHSGVVYRARQPHLDRDVAVKVIRPSVANRPAFIRRFDAEAQVVARIEHPHVVPLYDYWRDPGGAYLTMRWMRGGSLREALGGEPMDVETTATVTEQIAAALAAAHHGGVVHRDVKPDNVLLDEQGTAYLSDFGIARDLLSSEEAGAASGSSGYSSPEELLGGAVTAASDVHALGLVVYEMLTGAHPFAGSPPGVLSRRLIEEPVPPPSMAVAALPQGVDEVVLRATAKEPEARYGDPLQLARELNAAVGRAGTALLSVEDAAPRNPYRGLRPFGEADAGDFFGRSAYVERLIDQLRAEGSAGRFVAVVGPSGSGKSSVLRAGLVPALRRGAVTGSDRWLVARTVPDVAPFEKLTEALLENATEAPADLAASLRENANALARLLPGLLPPGTGLLLIIDQLEELYTLAGAEKAAAFLDSLTTALDVEPRLRVAVGIRADFYDRPLEHPAFGKLLAAATVPLPPLSRDGITEAVIRPAIRAGLEMQPELTAELVSGVTGRPGSLPLLQHALMELFERRDGNTLTLAAYHEIGGIAGALARRAEDVHRGFDAQERDLVRRVFLKLVTPGEAVDDTRRRVLVGDLDHLGDAVRESVIEPLAAARLISLDRDPATRAPTAEVAHEALLTAWGRLQGWIEEAREDLRYERSLEKMAAEWEDAGRDGSFLLRGTRLEQIESWTDLTDESLPPRSRDYIRASREARAVQRAAGEEARRREREMEARSRNRLRSFVAVLAVAALVAGGLAIFAFSQRRTASEQAAAAQREARIANARELSAAALNAMAGDPELAILLALQAVEATRVADGTVLREAEEALHSAVQASRVVLAVPGAIALDRAPALAFSPNGVLLATTQGDGSVTVWDAATGAARLSIDGHVGGSIGMAFGPRGELVTIGWDGAARIWSVETGTELFALRGDGAGLIALTFSADGARLAAADADGKGYVWDLPTRTRLFTLPKVESATGLSFSSDGRLLATAESSEMVVWDLEAGQVLNRQDLAAMDVAFAGNGDQLAVVGQDGLVQLRQTATSEEFTSFLGHRGHVTTVTFVGAGAGMATGGHDGTVRVWDTATGDQLLVLTGQTAAIDVLGVSPDGTRVAACCGNGRATVWDVTPGGERELLTFVAHEGNVFNVVFDTEGSALATAGLDGSAALWDAETGRQLTKLMGHDGPVSDVEFSPDGTRLATASFDTTARLWNAADGEELIVFRGHTAPVWGVSFTPAGDRLATGAEDATARIWDTATGSELALLGGHRDPVYDVAYSPDGTLVATVSNDAVPRLWDAATGAVLHTLEGHRGNIVEQAFSPDGSMLATAGFDGTARVWVVATGSQRLVLEGHSGILLDVDFSPDGLRIATASLDGTVRLWDVETGRETLKLTIPESPGLRLAFGGGGGLRLAVGSENGTVRVYTLDVEDLLELARSRLTRALTDAECRQYLHQDSCG